MKNGSGESIGKAAAWRHRNGGSSGNGWQSKRKW
jgi:hypothetical protein